MQIPTPYPSATPSPAELVRDASQIITIWNQLGPLMAVLGLAALALIVVLLVTRNGVTSNSAAINLLVKANAQKDQELTDAREQRKQEHEQHIESLGTIAAQTNRSNDLIEQGNTIMKAINDRGQERDATQKQLAEDFHALLTTGSAPVQEILSRVRTMTELLARIDLRTANWDVIAIAITPLITELSALRQEVKKHSTQPIPIITDPPAPPINGTEATS